MEKMDRRVRKTRALLLQGLVKMMENHDIQDISVKELTELVDINRGTFYLHYDDIYDKCGKFHHKGVIFFVFFCVVCCHSFLLLCLSLYPYVSDFSILSLRVFPASVKPYYKNKKLYYCHLINLC